MRQGGLGRLHSAYQTGAKIRMGCTTQDWMVRVMMIRAQRMSWTCMRTFRLLASRLQATRGTRRSLPRSELFSGIPEGDYLIEGQFSGLRIFESRSTDSVAPLQTTDARYSAKF